MAKNENDILQRLKDPKSKRKAFEDIVHLFSRKLYWQIHHILQNHNDTDDVLQNTFIKAWRGIDNFNGDASLSTWLYRIANNESITFLKQKKELVSIEDEGFSAPPSFVADEYFDGDDAEHRLIQAVSTLPAKQRQVFCMKYFDERKYEEISEMLNTSIGALKASYHIAVEKIKKILETD